MATRLKNPLFTKVDVVDEGANQRADIKLLKRKGVPEGSEGQTEPTEGLFKRFVNWLSGQGMSNEDIRKAATSFDEQLYAVSMDQIRDEIWSVCYALQNSLNSILCDAEMDAVARQEAMEDSVGQFQTAMTGYISKWAVGATASIRKDLEAPDKTDMPMILKARDNLAEIIEKSNDKKGELEEMLKIDKSKMTPEDKAAYEDIIKKYAVDTDPEGKADGVAKKAPEPKPEEDDPEEEIPDEGKKKTPAKKSLSGGEGEPADIYAGLHPAVAAELKALRKRADEAEERELLSIAKKYEVIGKKPEELVPTLKSLKAAGGTAYADMIGVLDSALEAVENSSLFGEIGKSRTGGAAPVKKSAAEGKIDTIAKSYIEKDPSMTMARAVAKAWEDHPELMEDYEDEAGF